MPVTAILFLVAFTVGCILAFARHPVYGLMTYIVTLYFDPTGQWWGRALLPHFRWELLPAAITLLAMAMHRGRGPSPLFRSGLFRGCLVFLAWIIIQSPWVVSQPAQDQLLSVWSKFLLVSIMICGCVDSWKHLKLILGSHVLGCVYMGWVAHAFYHGGRFGDFGLGSIKDANTGALQLVTGFIAAASLFLVANRWTKVLLLLGMGLIANGIIATVSRAGFLELVCSGVAFIMYAPKKYRIHLITAAVLAACCFIALSSRSLYWQRIDTIRYEGAQVHGVDTGHARIVVLESQWHMFREHPLGCGHGCTEALSPEFIPRRYLALGIGRRSSHNTFMTMLVDQGVPGALIYIAFATWAFRTIRRLIPKARSATGISSTFLPGLLGIIIAIIVGDLFNSFVLLEVRIWFLSLLVSYAHLLRQAESSHSQSLPTQSQQAPSS
jgi:O-antigen ligase